MHKTEMVRERVRLGGSIGPQKGVLPWKKDRQMECQHFTMTLAAASRS